MIFDVNTDTDGYLINSSDWSEEIARIIAKKENIELTKDHWTVILFLRHFYQTYQLHPATRIIVKELAKNIGNKKGNSLYLHQLFPDGPVKQASKIAGLPKPLKCL